MKWRGGRQIRAATESVNLRKPEEGSELTEGDSVSKREILAEKLRKRRERKERMKKFRAIKKARRAAREATAAKLAAQNPTKPVPSSAKPATNTLRAGTKRPEILKPQAEKPAAQPTQPPPPVPKTSDKSARGQHQAPRNSETASQKIRRRSHSRRNRQNEKA